LQEDLIDVETTTILSVVVAADRMAVAGPIPTMILADGVATTSPILIAGVKTGEAVVEEADEAAAATTLLAAAGPMVVTAAGANRTIPAKVIRGTIKVEIVGVPRTAVAAVLERIGEVAEVVAVDVVLVAMAKVMTKMAMDRKKNAPLFTFLKNVPRKKYLTKQVRN